MASDVVGYDVGQIESMTRPTSFSVGTAVAASGDQGGSDLGIRYALELRFLTGKFESRWMHELTWVENVQVEQPMAVSAKYPIDESQDAVVQRSKTRRETVTLSGATGVESRLSPTGDGGRVAETDGLGRIRALQQFLREFSNVASEYEGALSRQSNGPKLLLHGLWEGFSYELISADLQRTLSVDQALGDFQWVLRCVTLKRIEREPPPKNPMDADTVHVNPRRDVNWSRDQGDAQVQRILIADEVERVRASGVIARSWVDEGIDVFDTSRLTVEKGVVALRSVQNSQERLRTLVGRANLLLQRIDEARDVASQIGAFPAALFSATLNTISAAQDEIGDVAAEVVGVVPQAYHDLSAAYSDWRIKAHGMMARLRVRFILGVDDANDAVMQSTALSQSFLQGGQALRQVFVTEGETLTELAARVLGDANRWTEIAAINGLPDPWTLRDGSPMAVGGAVLLVPATSGATTGYDDDLLGESYFLDPMTSDLVMRDDGFQRIRGFPLVLQSVRERARNVRGKSAAAPEWGMLGLVGHVVNNGDAVRFAIDAKAQFTRDSRVTSVRGLRLTQNADTLALDLAIETVGGEGPLSLSTPVAAAR
jgi:hypothetical protein